MTHKFELPILILLLSVFFSSCYPDTKNPVVTDWPDYVPFEGSQISFEGIAPPPEGSCQVHAVDLLGAWVTAGSPEIETFSFSDTAGKQCQGLFEADILPVFSQANLWYANAPSCRTCHGPDVEISYGRLDLSSYQGITAGAGRESADSKGEDILGGGNWESSTLYKVLVGGEMPPSQPAEANPQGLVVHAGRN